MRASIILADPCWQYRDKALAGNRGAICKYPVMTDKDIYALPVESIADDDCALCLWTTMPKLQEGLNTIEAWGFTFKTCLFTWIKQNGTGTWFMGMGRYSRSNAELCLLGTKGKPQRVDAGVNQIITAPRMKHSAKPAEARDRIVRLLGDIPRCELFAREQVGDWIALGNELAPGPLSLVGDLRDTLPELAAL